MPVRPRFCFILHGFHRDLQKELCRVRHSQCISSSGHKRGGSLIRQHKCWYLLERSVHSIKRQNSSGCHSLVTVLWIHLAILVLISVFSKQPLDFNLVFQVIFFFFFFLTEDVLAHWHFFFFQCHQLASHLISESYKFG